MPPKKVEREHCDASSERRLRFCECRDITGSVCTGAAGTFTRRSQALTGTETRRDESDANALTRGFQVRDAAWLRVEREGRREPRLTYRKRPEGACGLKVNNKARVKYRDAEDALG